MTDESLIETCKIVKHPLFIIGIVLRLLLIGVMAPHAVTAWYVPFLNTSTTVFTWDPWSVWIHGGGNIVAFPYGYAMWLFFLPLVLLAKISGIKLIYAYSLTILAADCSLLLVLRKMIPHKHELLLLTYWLSPTIIIASYCLGFNDLIPALLLVVAVLLVRQMLLIPAGLLLSAAVSAKLSMVVALPFFIIYLFNHRALRHYLGKFILGFSVGSVVLGAPFLLSSAGLKMLLDNPELTKIYQLSLHLTDNVSIFIVPLIYLVLLYWVWRVRRLNFELFHATIGITLLLLVLMVPSSPGWFIWCVPFLVIYQVSSGHMAIFMVTLFSWLYVGSTLILTPLQFSTVGPINVEILLHLNNPSSTHIAALLYTAMVAVGIIMVLRIWREAIDRNDFFRLSRKPFAIGVAGDSGAGKDTFVDAIAGLFGDHSVVTLSGDDYHLWDRQKPMWRVMTHLNPMANDLEGFCNALVALTDGKQCWSRHYDHNSGKMSKPFLVSSNDFIIASGLHALYLPVLRECYNLKIYLDIDEGLRRYFKIKRDVAQRGHTLEQVNNSFSKREPDAEQFVRPQVQYADLVLSLQPINQDQLVQNDAKPLRFKLVVRTRNSFNEMSIYRILVGVCNLHVDVVVSNDGSDIQLTIDGEVCAADIALAANILCPRVQEFLDLTPQWQDGMMGVMQLITLVHISQALTKRFIQ